MPAFQHYKQVIPAGYYNIAITMTSPGIPDAMVNTFGYGGAGYTLTPGDLALLGGVWATGPMAAISDQVTFTRIAAYDAGGIIEEAPFNVAGADAGPIGPLSNSVIVQKRTGVSGRRNRGRFYLPGVEESHVNAAGDLDTVQRDAYQALMDDFLDDVNGVNVAAEMVLLHSKGWNGDTPPADPGNAPAPTVITALAVQTKIGTQRRRIR